MRRAVAADIPGIDAFLTRHIESSMIPLSNLLTHGLDGPDPRSMRFWIDDDTGGVLGLTREGLIMPQLPDFHAWARVAHVLAGESLLGCMGELTQINSLLAACGLTAYAEKIGSGEPLMALNLRQLSVPTGAGDLHPLEAVARDLIVDWRRAFRVEAMGMQEQPALDLARRDIDTFIALNSHRVLIVDSSPVAMTGFNAICKDTVQIGGVYTPPDFRGRGYGGDSVALHLAQSRAEGKRRALLSAATEAAARVYKRIGFQRIGTYTIRIFDTVEGVR